MFQEAELEEGVQGGNVEAREASLGGSAADAVASTPHLVNANRR